MGLSKAEVLGEFQNRLTKGWSEIKDSDGSGEDEKLRERIMEVDVLEGQMASLKKELRHLENTRPVKQERGCKKLFSIRSTKEKRGEEWGRGL